MLFSGAGVDGLFDLSAYQKAFSHLGIKQYHSL